MLRNRPFPAALLKEWRLPREQRAPARSLRREAKLDAAVHARAAHVEAESPASGGRARAAGQ